MRSLRSALAAALLAIVLTSCAYDSHGYSGDEAAQKSHERIVQIVDALNDHDADALKAMFTDYALANNSDEIDEGLDYLLSLFPDGDVVWQDKDTLPGGEYKRIDDDHRTILARSMYTVSSGGKNYYLFFAEFTTNTIDPDNVGIYAMGADPEVEPVDLESPFFNWAGPFQIDTTAAPGVYIPEASSG